LDIVLFDLIDYQNQRTGFDAENQKSVEYQTQYDVPDKTKAGMKISAYIIRLDAILTLSTHYHCDISSMNIVPIILSISSWNDK
jgi:hypothetical protein